MKIQFGAFAPKLIEQIGKIQNIKIYQKDADNITRLLIRGLLTESEGINARKRLITKIEKEARHG
jgi:hypothetical protein